MDKIRKYLGDAAIVAICAIYFYFVYIVGQYGYLNAFGLFNTSGLVPLRQQEIIFNTISIALTTIVIITLGTLIIRFMPSPIQRRHHFINYILYQLGFSLTLLIITAPILVGLLVINKRLFYIQFVYTLISPLIVTLLERPLNKLITSNVGQVLNKFSKTRNGQRTYMLGLIFIFSLPIYSYSFGQIDARTGTVHYTTDVNKQSYLVVATYSDETIYVQIEKNKVIPHFIINRLTGGNSTEVINVKETGKLDFTEIDKLHGSYFY